jgi:hypothetical protein
MIPNAAIRRKPELRGTAISRVGELAPAARAKAKSSAFSAKRLTALLVKDGYD